jgi:hypothetical protein
MATPLRIKRAAALGLAAFATIFATSAITAVLQRPFWFSVQSFHFQRPWPAAERHCPVPPLLTGDDFGLATGMGAFSRHDLFRYDQFRDELSSA